MKRLHSEESDRADLSCREHPGKKKQHERTAEFEERRILWISLGAGALFAAAEFIASIYTHSQSVLMDAAYDTSELVVILLTIFLTKLFHQPVSEKRPYGFLQAESIFIIIKGFMMLAVTVSLSAKMIDTALSGGNEVDGGAIAVLEFWMGIASIAVLAVMMYLNRTVSSPTVNAEILGWKMDVAYSLGLAGAFLFSTLLHLTPFDFLAPYFDQIIAAVVVLLTIPENMKILRGAIKDVFLLSPEEELVDKIKEAGDQVLSEYAFEPVFYDITRTGRHLWASVYFKCPGEVLVIQDLRQASQKLQSLVNELTEDCTAELIVAAGEGDGLPFEAENPEQEN